MDCRTSHHRVACGPYLKDGSRQYGLTIRGRSAVRDNTVWSPTNWRSTHPHWVRLVGLYTAPRRTTWGRSHSVAPPCLRSHDAPGLQGRGPDARSILVVAALR